MAGYSSNVNIHEFEDSDDIEMGGPSSGSGGGGGRQVFPLHAQSHANGDSHKVVADFDSFSSDAEKLSAILKCADVEMHKHMLAVDYFRFRKYGLLLPTIAMSLIIAICGFVAASNIMKDHMKVHDASMQDFLTILVATFGFIVLLLTILGNGLDYNSKIAFHRAAAEDLAGLCDKIRLYRMERSMDEHIKEEAEERKDFFEDDASSERDESDEDLPSVHEDQIVPHSGHQMVKKQIKQTKKLQKRRDKLTKTLVKQKVRQAREEQELSKDVITFYGYHTELHQIMRGCRSDVPPRITKFFHVMENRVELMSLSRLGVEEESRMRKNQIVRLCANEIYNEICNHWAWPITTPSVDKTIEGALKRVGQLLNMNYRAPRRCKLLPCCAITLCCKKSTTNNVFAIINEGIDQRELDMMQAERAEVVRMENDRRARRNAGPEQVIEMKDDIFDGTSQDPRGRGGAGGGKSRRSHPDYYASADHSRMSRDPDGETYNDMMTEDSYSFRSGPSVKNKGGGYASQYTDQERLLPPMQEDYDMEDDMMTEEDGTYQESWAGGTEVSDDEGTKKKSKKKKKKKSKKKKKKKEAKKKEKKEESVYDDDDDGDYTEYSEEYSKEEYSEYSEYSEED